MRFQPNAQKHSSYTTSARDRKLQLVQRKYLERPNLIFDVTNHRKIYVLLTGGSSSTAGDIVRPSYFHALLVFLGLFHG